MIDFKIHGNQVGFCFLDSIITDEDNRIRVLQLICNVKYTFKTYLYNVTVEQAKQFMSEYKGNSNMVFDFSFNDEGRLLYSSSTVVVQKGSESYFNKLIGTKEDYSSNMLSIYDLIFMVCKRNGLYISRHYVDKLDNDYAGNGIVDFRKIRVSASSMFIGFSVRTDDGWKSEEILDIDGISLSSNKFYFAVDYTDSKEFHEYGVKEVGQYRIYNRDLVVFEFDKSLPIYKHTKSSFKFFDSVITKYCRDLELSLTVERTARIINNTCLNYNEEKPENIEKEPYIKKPKALRYSIVFESSEKAVPIYRLRSIVNMVFERKAASENKLVPINDEDMEYDLYTREPNSLEKIAYKTCDRLLISTACNRMDLLDLSKNYMDSYRDRALFVQLFLYSYRASCYSLNYSLGHQERFWRIYEAGEERFVTVRRCVDVY